MLQACWMVLIETYFDLYWLYIETDVCQGRYAVTEEKTTTKTRQIKQNKQEKQQQQQNLTTSQKYLNWCYITQN